jgi:hypothetical protein
MIKVHMHDRRQTCGPNNDQIIGCMFNLGANVHALRPMAITRGDVKVDVSVNTELTLLQYVTYDIVPFGLCTRHMMEVAVPGVGTTRVHPAGLKESNCKQCTMYNSTVALARGEEGYCSA